MDKIKIKVPEGWHEVSIRKFIDISNIDAKTELIKGIEIVSILTDTDPEVIKGFGKDDLDNILSMLSWAKKEPTNDYRTSLEVNGETYELIKLNSLTNGEWVDVDVYSANWVNNLHNIMAIFYRKQGEEYKSSVMNKRALEFLDTVNISDVYGTMLFFSIIGSKYISLSQDYLTNLLKTESLKN